MNLIWTMTVSAKMNIQSKMPAGAQQSYACAIQMQLQKEISGSHGALTSNWLLDHLKLHGWWIQSEFAPKFAKKLKLKEEPAEYYKDIYVWLPDVRWVDTMMKPCCPTCKSNENVIVKGFRENHFGRLIVGLKNNYYIISRRYKCKECESRSKLMKRQIGQIETEVNEIGTEGVEVTGNLSIEIKTNYQYNFMGWNEVSLPLFPYGRGSEFPAFFTLRAGLDKALVDMMRPLFDKGFRPDAMSAMLLELHSKEYTISANA